MEDDDDIKIPNSVKPVGTSFDATDMSTPELIDKMDAVDKSYADILWDRCYGAAALHSRKDWQIGLNTRPTFDHFVDFLRHTWEKKELPRREIHAMVLVYNTYSPLKWAGEAVALIKEMASISLARYVIPWVRCHPDKVLEILELCQTVKDKAKLRALCVQRYPLPGQGKTGGSGGEDESDRRGAMQTLAFLAANPGTVAADKMFIPRCIPWSPAQEWAWYSVATAYMDERSIGLDELFNDMFDAWMYSLDEETRERVLTVAKKDWQSQVRSHNVKSAEWPWD